MLRGTVEKVWITRAGLPAAIVMVNGFTPGSKSHRCGYVRMEGAASKPAYSSVHGGITFNELFEDLDKECLTTWGNVLNALVGPSPWLGFDCNHGGDRSLDPMVERFKGSNAVFRSHEFCIEQCEKLASEMMSENLVPH